MELKYFTLTCILVFNFSFSQMKTSEREDLSRINRNWRLAKTISGTYGITDTGGKVVVSPVYSKIYTFGQYSPDLALVKNISGTYGFINKSGIEIVPSRYNLHDIKTNFSAIYKKYIR